MQFELLFLFILFTLPAKWNKMNFPQNENGNQFDMRIAINTILIPFAVNVDDGVRFLITLT